MVPSNDPLLSVGICDRLSAREPDVAKEPEVLESSSPSLS